MDRISKHISHALQKSECVVIPGMGAILRHGVPSRYLSSSQTLTAPSCSLGFNPQLSLSDGVLLGAYIREEKMDPQTAQRVLEADVRNLRNALERNAEQTLEGLGSLKMDISGRISFHPIKDGFSLGSLMGLENVIMPTLEDMRRQRAIEASERLIREKVQSGRKSSTFPLWQTVAAASVTILVLLGVIISGATGMDNVSRAFLSLEEVFTVHKTAPGATLPKAVKEETVTEAILNVPSASAKEEMPATMTMPKAPEITMSASPVLHAKSYHVIIASLGSPQEAVDMATALVRDGNREAKAILLDGKNRVSICSLGTLEEASAKVKDLQGDGKNKDAWILKR